MPSHKKNNNKRMRRTRSLDRIRINLTHRFNQSAQEELAQKIAEIFKNRANSRCRDESEDFNYFRLL